jgi:hypothetical protein
MTPTAKRGRPATRNRTALLFYVWRMVREEIAFRRAAGVSQACRQLLARRKRIRIQEANGKPLADIIDHHKLRQWYAAAETARLVAGSELEARCAAWDAQTSAHYPTWLAMGASGAALLEGQRAGLSLAYDFAELNMLAEHAAGIARSNAPPIRRPRKHR